MTLSELIAALGQARTASNGAYEHYKELKGLEDQLRYELELELKQSGLKTAKGHNFTATIVERPTVVVKNETEVLEWLREAPNVESDLYIGLKKTEFSSLATSMLKGTGEVIPGTEVEVRESLAIKANAKPKKIQG